MAGKRDKAKSRYSKEDKAKGDVDFGMDDIERNNYKALRSKGFEDEESRYHATNPRGRLFPKDTTDPWAASADEDEKK